MNTSVASVECRRFRNAIAILRAIDQPDFNRATGLDEGVWWRNFREDPSGMFLRLKDWQAEAIWKIIESRQTSR